MIRYTVGTNLIMLTGWKVPILGRGALGQARMLGLIGTLMEFIGALVRLHGKIACRHGLCLILVLGKMTAGTPDGTEIHLHGVIATSFGTCIVNRVQGRSSGMEIHGSMPMDIPGTAESLRMG